MEGVLSQLARRLKLFRQAPRSPFLTCLGGRKRQALALIEGAPHGFNATHAEQFNRALLDSLS